MSVRRAVVAQLARLSVGRATAPVSVDSKPAMGRPRSDNPKCKRVQLVMTEGDEATCRSAASEVDETLSAYMVTSGLQRAARMRRKRR